MARVPTISEPAVFSMIAFLVLWAATLIFQRPRFADVILLIARRQG